MQKHTPASRSPHGVQPHGPHGSPSDPTSAMIKSKVLNVTKWLQSFILNTRCPHRLRPAGATRGSCNASQDFSQRFSYHAFPQGFCGHGFAAYSLP
eukprot:1184038-Prorocentrum_minimum.AAC.3